MKPKRTISAYILLVGILGLSVIGGVVAYGIYASLVKTQITTDQAALIKPLDGEIDTNLLNNLETRRKFSATELAVEITPTPTPSEQGSQGTSVIPEEASQAATTNQ
ncbi:MAG: hypothetical protein UW35_C0043G0002 [Candidatus Collierbacteria bacterium GW2011_GWF2_44_15]|uniref:Uncharacterized protein n=4 Tax=Patescibacteria group TaxID=1783273 RepID=A0A0G1HF95_9BACT|nr:MAG: hypothetical protein UR19_C0012G0004 [Candidatus Nomurabacteria bacterium GW2011_GWF1_31_48]KKT34424.1 MAG: hypothetical protein UW23_C0039G0008 [Candidatus Collierbacteria bacterium GW2011_GWA1_44_12]KKT45128.1 MAG: hypothetical protein UW35_C0043G0002 [Candidatus Collierbacteria bacterium GW2011_GWF2_44_15]KKU27964.1 MAG: hypothetical protein UX41_C0041G0002 [Candidatus Collierbacteria bacterium GW2011_GWE1_46_18]